MEEHSALWPEGDNQELLYAMIHYIQQILQDHGTHLMSEQLIKLSKIRVDMRSLLETLNGIDFKVPDLNFTLPGIYKFYNNTLQETLINNTHATCTPSTLSRHHSIEYEPISSISSRSNTILTNITNISADTNSNTNHDTNNAMNDEKKDKYKMFDTFVSKLKQENNLNANENLKESSPQYLVFLEEARRKYNVQLKSEEHMIKSLDNVPSLRNTLYTIRHHESIESIEEMQSNAIINEINALGLNKHNNYKPNTKQCIAIQGYYNTFLSVYKNGTSEFKNSQIGLNEIFYTIPISKDNVYIKTNDNLYLGSDENGLLFIGNVTKFHQIWTIELNKKENEQEKEKDNTYSIKNSFGLYLCANKNGTAIANGKYKKDVQKFIIYNNNINIPQFIKDNNNNNNNNKNTIRKHKPKPKQKRRRKISIDDMDIIPSSMNMKRADIINNRKSVSGTLIPAPKLYRKRNGGNHRRHSTRTRIAPPPPRKAITPPPHPAQQSNEDMYLKLGIHNNKKNNKIVSEINNNSVSTLKRYRKSIQYVVVDKHLHKPIANQNKMNKNHQRAKTMMSGVIGMNNDPLMNELKQKLQMKKKSATINNVLRKENHDNNTKETPALPNKSAKIVVQQVRSKYQRPLPALPQYEKINQID